MYWIFSEKGLGPKFLFALNSSPSHLLSSLPAQNLPPSRCGKMLKLVHRRCNHRDHDHHHHHHAHLHCHDHNKSSLSPETVRESAAISEWSLKGKPFLHLVIKMMIMLMLVMSLWQLWLCMMTLLHLIIIMMTILMFVMMMMMMFVFQLHWRWCSPLPLPYSHNGHQCGQSQSSGAFRKCHIYDLDHNRSASSLLPESPSSSPLQKSRRRGSSNVSTTLEKFLQLVNLDLVSPFRLNLQPQPRFFPSNQLLSNTVAKASLESSLETVFDPCVLLAVIRAPSKSRGAGFDVC